MKKLFFLLALIGAAATAATAFKRESAKSSPKKTPNATTKSAQ